MIYSFSFVSCKSRQTIVRTATLLIDMVWATIYNNSSRAALIIVENCKSLNTDFHFLNFTIYMVHLWKYTKSNSVFISSFMDPTRRSLIQLYILPFFLFRAAIRLSVSHWKGQQFVQIWWLRIESCISMFLLKLQNHRPLSDTSLIRSMFERFQKYVLFWECTQTSVGNFSPLLSQFYIWYLNTCRTNW